MQDKRDIYIHTYVLVCKTVDNALKTIKKKQGVEKEFLNKFGPLVSNNKPIKKIET